MSDITMILGRADIEARYADDGDRLDAFAQAADAHRAAMEALHRGAVDRSLTASEQRRWDAHERERDDLEAAHAQLRQRLDTERDQRVAERRRRWGSVQVSAPASLDDNSPTGAVRAAHDVLDRMSDTLSAEGAERLAAAITDARGADAARIITARATPAYESAFAKLITAPDPARAYFGFTAAEHDAFAQVEHARASLTLTTGGALLPLAYDPNVAALTSDGSANPMRRLARVRTAAATPFRAVTTAGVTAAWVAENTAMADGSPSFTGTEVALHKMAAYVTASYELFADAGTELMNDLPMILADARDTAENAAFISGSGSGAPVGIITAISATAGATVTATTRGAFTSASAVDTLALLNALPPRARQSSSVAVFANNTTINTVRQQVVGTAGVPLVDMSAAVPSIVGTPWYEASSITANTTSGNILAVAGDFSRYLIVDHVAGPALEFVQNVVDGDGLPTGTRGWVYWARVGADSLDDARFRYLLA